MKKSLTRYKNCPLLPASIAPRISDESATADNRAIEVPSCSSEVALSPHMHPVPTATKTDREFSGLDFATIRKVVRSAERATPVGHRGEVNWGYDARPGRAYTYPFVPSCATAITAMNRAGQDSP